MSQINSQGCMLTPSAAKRTADAVRKVLDNQGTRSDQRPGVPVTYNAFWAKILAESNTSAGHYNWSAQSLIAGNFSTGTVSDANFSATEVNKTPGLLPGTIVKLECAGFNGSNPVYTFPLPTTLAQPFKVVGHPPLASGATDLDPYAICVQIFNGSTGTKNISIGVVQGHPINSLIYAMPVADMFEGGTYTLDVNGNHIAWREVGSYGQYFTAGLNFNASATAAGGGLIYHYDINAGSTILAQNKVAVFSPLAAFSVVAATEGTCVILPPVPSAGPSIVYQLIYAYEPLNGPPIVAR